MGRHVVVRCDSWTCTRRGSVGLNAIEVVADVVSGTGSQYGLQYGAKQPCDSGPHACENGTQRFARCVAERRFGEIVL
ncbi:hypothetical protein Rcae01_05163 [Novipirellula caenicola]|uniref:Uncharacterized protein n=1 Tax=Novipirellula caenicola TaxID=1536901 RepID=A0ABP9W1B9_9BACT